MLGVFDWSGNNPLPPEIWLLPYFLPLHPGRLFSIDPIENVFSSNKISPIIIYYCLKNEFEPHKHHIMLHNAMGLNLYVMVSFLFGYESNICGI